MDGSESLSEPLTQREREILHLLAEGLTDREIAQRLLLAQGTVKWYNKQLYGKLGVHSREEAVTRAREMGLFEDGESALYSGTVTFLFTDIEGSTKLWERHPEAMRVALKRHDTLLRETIRENDGFVFKTVGDAFCAVFDDAVKALTAAYSGQIDILDQDWGQTPVRIRIALHTGTAEVRDEDYFGPAVNHIARLLAAGHGGQILLSSATRVLIQKRIPKGWSLQDLGEHRLKDLEEAERIYQLITPDLPTDFPPLSSLDSYPENLPVRLTSFVGRQQEIKAANQLLAENRLLTLTGPPGTGKSRLAIQIARQNTIHFQDGVFFVDLAPINDPELMLSRIAQALNLMETSDLSLIKILTHHLREKQVLLILDNFEQIIDAARQVCDLLSTCPRLKILVTTREPLRVYGEQEYWVPPLALPDPQCPEPLLALSQYEAVELFCQRARAVKSDFRLVEENAPAVCEICVRLDGLPLAIELAAARIKLLGPEDMCARLGSRLMMLTGGSRDLPARLQTLRAAVEWSYNLLDVDEQSLFNRLSVFQGGRTIQAIEVICFSDFSFTILDGVDSLLNKNLLFSKEGRTGETRFHMLETIHEYARERLAQDGETNDFKTRHAIYFVELVERAEAEFHGKRQAYWFARLTDELDNIRAALKWTLEGMDVELGARLAAAMRDYWYFTGLIAESSEWLKNVLKLKGRISSAVWAKTLSTASRLAYAAGKHEEGEVFARQALTLAREIGNKEISAWALIWLPSHIMASQDHIAQAIVQAEESLRLFRELDHQSGIIFALTMLGEIMRLNGVYDQAGRYYKECLTLSRELGNRRHEAISLANLSYIAYYKGDYNRAIDCSKKSVALLNSLQMGYACAIVLAMIAGPIGAIGMPKQAARLLAASEAQLEMMGATTQPGDRPEVDRFKEAVKGQLNEIEFDQAWSEGQAMTMDEAIAEALGITFSAVDRRPDLGA